MSMEEWLVFLAIWIAASLPLGPNALNCIVAAASNGFLRSLWAIVGIMAASISHMTLTILGAATLLLASATAFQVLKLAGAAYLIWMGIALWRRPDMEISVERRDPVSARTLVRRGFLISMSNPKAILAYFAVFSQFLDSKAALAGQLMILVPTVLTITLLVYAGYSAFGLGVGRLLGTVRRRLVFNRGVGSLYILAGLGLAAGDAGLASRRA